MTKDQAIMYLRSMQGICSPQDRMAKKAVRMATDALSAEAVQGWISCSERLPERGVGLHYLVTLKEGHVFKDDVYEAFYDKYGWHLGDNELADDDVIAWMPLPEAYKGGSGEAVL